MSLISTIYSRVHRLLAKKTERGEYSSGLWAGQIRNTALELCRDVRGRALEIGCGEGLFVSALLRQNPDLEVWGIDSDIRRMAQVEKKCAAFGQRVHLAHEDACRLSFGDGYFDAVICINVVFNMDSLATVTRALAQMQRVCKPGGKIIFEFRNSRNLVLRAKYGLARYYDETVRHIHLKTYNPAEITRMLAHLGLKVTRSRPLGFCIADYAPVIVIEAVK